MAEVFTYSTQRPLDGAPWLRTGRCMMCGKRVNKHETFGFVDTFFVSEGACDDCYAEVEEQARLDNAACEAYYVETTLAGRAHAPTASAGSTPARTAIPVMATAILGPDGVLVPVPAAPSYRVYWREQELGRPWLGDVSATPAHMRQLVTQLPDLSSSVLRVVQETYVRHDRCGRVFLTTLSVLLGAGTAHEHAYPEVTLRTTREAEAEAAWAVAVRLLAFPDRVLVTHGDDGEGLVTWVSDMAFSSWLETCREHPESC